MLIGIDPYGSLILCQDVIDLSPVSFDLEILREVFAERTAEAGLKFYYPKPILTTDNAAMIAAAGTAKLMRGEIAAIDVNADPNLRLAVAERDFPAKRWK